MASEAELVLENLRLTLRVKELEAEVALLKDREADYELLAQKARAIIAKY